MCVWHRKREIMRERKKVITIERVVEGKNLCMCACKEAGELSPVLKYVYVREKWKWKYNQSFCFKKQTFLDGSTGKEV